MKGYVVTVSAAALVASSLALAAPQAQGAGAGRWATSPPSWPTATSGTRRPGF